MRPSISIGKSFTINENHYENSFFGEPSGSKFELSTYNRMKKRIEDLENTIKINKTIITDLLNTNRNISLKKNLDSLHSENEILRKKLEIVIKERDESQRDLLILQQKISPYKCAENNQKNNELQENKDLQDKLNLKEYKLQVCEEKLSKAFKLLAKYSNLDKDIKLLFQEYNIEKNENIYITNVIEENSNLKKELSQAKAKINRLKLWLQEIIESKMVKIDKPNGKSLKKRKQSTDETNKSELLPNSIKEKKFKNLNIGIINTISTGDDINSEPSSSVREETERSVSE